MGRREEETALHHLKSSDQLCTKCLTIDLCSIHRWVSLNDLAAGLRLDIMKGMTNWITRNEDSLSFPTNQEYKVDKTMHRAAIEQRSEKLFKGRMSKKWCRVNPMTIQIILLSLIFVCNNSKLVKKCPCSFSFSLKVTFDSFHNWGGEPDETDVVLVAGIHYLAFVVDPREHCCFAVDDKHNVAAAQIPRNH